MRAKKPTNTKDELSLGIDYGETNIGLAFGRNGLASPLSIIPAKNEDEALREIARFAIENKVTKIIMGIPLTADGKETAESLKVRRFSKLLKIYLKKPLELVNEHSTSIEALDEAIDIGMSQKGRRKVDNLSAALILTRYFEKS